VPSAMAELVRAGAVPPGVRTINLAGEALPRDLAEAIHRRTRATRLLNLYGPSETTTFSTWAEVAAGDSRPPAIGRPVAGTRVHLLGPGLAPVPAGAVGEVWIGGRGVARGYLGRPELTADRFRPDPFGEAPGARDDLGEAPGGRLYRTGDLARWRRDGELEYLGRVDQQVKIRGFRVEPGEVEAALRAEPGVAEAAVVARRAPAGDLRLVAYVAGRAGSPPDAGELRRRLAAHLPRHMVPAAFVALAALPRTPNGKLDRKRLPEPEWDATGGAEAGETADRPETPLEAQLAAIFREVLGTERVGLHDSFFALGGHSLLAARALARVRAAVGVELPLRTLFEAPTVAALAALLAGRAEAGKEDEPLSPQPRGAESPLSSAQERLWFLDRLEPGSPLYNMPAAARLAGPLDERALAAALAAVAARHEVLRTAYAERDGRPVGGEFERCQAGELAPPVGELLGQGAAVEPRALRFGEVGVLERQLGERRGLAAAERAVERPHLAQEDAHRPAVADDVVEVEEDGVLARRSGPRRRSKGRSDSSPASRESSPSRRGGGSAARSIRGSAASTSGETTCTGCPSSAPNVVRSDSWRSTTPASVAARTSGESGPRRRTELNRL